MNMQLVKVHVKLWKLTSKNTNIDWKMHAKYGKNLSNHMI